MLSTMKAPAPVLTNQLVILEPVNEQTVDLLIQWTLDPVAQGPHKRVPAMAVAELRALFLHSADRQYFLIRRTADGRPLGRFYYHAWRFGGETEGIDWELNILLADPGKRGKGIVKLMRYQVITRQKGRRKILHSVLMRLWPSL
jgi:hypothetical protein